MSDPEVGLDRVFPPEQCLSEDEMQRFYEYVGVDVVDFFSRGPYDGVVKAPTYLEQPFAISPEECKARKIAFTALTAGGDERLQNLAKLRQKLSRAS